MPPNNKHPESLAFDVLTDSIKRHGMRIPVFANRGGVVKSGFYRFWAAQSAGLKEVPVVEVEKTSEIAAWFEVV